jgi:tetratricopeptide (TPR) repeat protein
LLVATFAVYQPVWHAGFIWDDDELLTDNPVIKKAGGWYLPWFTASTLDYYPMTFTVWWLEWHLWGDHALGYHLSNVLLHGLSAVFLWRVLLRLKIPGALLAAAIFAVHPVNVESTAWIAEGKNTLAMFFYTLTLLLWLEFDDTGQWKWYALALAGFALGMFSKSAIAPVPVLLLGIAWWRRGRVDAKDLLRAVPFFVVTAAICCVSIWFHEHRAMGQDIVRTDSFWSRLAVAGYAVWFYLDKAILPLNLIFVYPRWQIDVSNALNYLPGILLVAALVVCWCYRRSWGKALFFALAYFVLLLLPILGFLNIYFMRYSLVADHWQYFAIIGPIALVASVIRKPALAVVIVLAVGTLTWKQCAIYADSETLWRVTLARNPGCVIALDNLGRARLDKGDTDDAIQLCQQALAKDPDSVTAQFNLGEALTKKGQLNDALASFQKAMQLDPGMSGIPERVGEVYLKQGNFAAAIPYFQKAIQLQPDYALAWCNLGYTLLQQGRLTEAMAYYNKAIELNPRYALAHNDLGNILLQLGGIDPALEQFQQAAVIDPNFAEAHFNIAEILLARGNVDEARSQYEKSIEINPGLYQARYKLGNILASKGREADAISQYEAVLRLQPNDALACNNLAWILAASANASLRNGPRAVELAGRADAQANGRNPIYLGTLAAAYAETGRFDDAVKAIDRALALANGNSGLTAALEKQRVLAKTGLPFHESPH